MDGVSIKYCPFVVEDRDTQSCREVFGPTSQKEQMLLLDPEPGPVALFCFWRLQSMVDTVRV